LNYRKYLFLFLIISFFTLLSSIVFSEETIKFKWDHFILLNKNQKVFVYVVVFIPYNQLNFQIADTSYEADVNISSILYSHGEQKGGDLWTKKIQLKDFKKTTSDIDGILWSFDFPASSGNYDLKVTVTDLHTNNFGKASDKISIKEPKNIWISQPIFFKKDSEKKRKWLLASKINAPLDSVFSFIEIYTDSNFINDYLLRLRMVDKDNRTVLKINKNATLGSSIENYIFAIPLKKLSEGMYTATVELIKNSKTLYVTRKKINIVFPFFLSKRYLERVEEMSYITKNDEGKKLKNAKPEEREKVWNEFWEEKDPIPETPQNETSEEYFKRVDYANEHFSTFQRGWKTDRGRIYIIYGPPDEVESHPFERESPPYQIWYYYHLGKRFIFADLSLTGDYTLIRE